MKLSNLYTPRDRKYIEDVSKLIKKTLFDMGSVCYISLDKSGDSVLEFCKKNKIDLKKVIIIDMISNRFKKCKSTKNIIYLEIENMNKNFIEISKIIEKNRCSSIIFDSISNLQVYYSKKDFVNFAKKLLSFSELNDITANIIIQKEDTGQNWTQSLIPFTGQIKEVKFLK